MKRATTLGQLFAIREHNRDRLHAHEDVLGTALGKEDGDGDPAILVFVRRKIGEPWLPKDRVLPDHLEDPGGLTCPLDVIAAQRGEDEFFRPLDAWGGELGRLIGRSELVGTDPLGEVNIRLRDRLRGAADKMTPGSQLTYRNREGNVFYGTLACFARDRTSGDVGFLTNRHVGVFDGNSLYHPDLGLAEVGVAQYGIAQISARERHGDLIFDRWGDRPSIATVDAGFCKLTDGRWPDQVDPRLSLLDEKAGKIVEQPLGEPLAVDLDSMEPVGREVLGVGRTRGLQRGVIAAYAHEYVADDGLRHYDDYLVVGEGWGEFSDGGDSGKLLVTADDFRPVALLWGGSWQRLRAGRELENWTTATEIGFILEALDLEILSSLPSSHVSST